MRERAFSGFQEAVRRIIPAYEEGDTVTDREGKPCQVLEKASSKLDVLQNGERWYRVRTREGDERMEREENLDRYNRPAVPVDVSGDYNVDSELSGERSGGQRIGEMLGDAE